MTLEGACFLETNWLW